MSRIDAVDLRAFPTKGQREFKQNGGGKVPTTVLYTYWTNFDRRTPKAKYALFEGQAVYDPPFWFFKTNLSPVDLGAMSAGAKEVFLK